MKMWKRLFRLPLDVAELLTDLTTYQGDVPQGAATSSYVENLILWDIEPQLVARFEKQLLTYSRYVDDVTISKSKAKMSTSEKTFAISSVNKMLRQKGLRLNRRKHQVSNSGSRQAIHGVNINSGRATFGKKRKDAIRIEVHNLEKAKDTETIEEWSSRYRSTKGKVLELSKLHPEWAQKYLNSLDVLAQNRSNTKT